MFEKNPILRWRKYNNYYFLEADKCSKCNKVHYPKGYLCTCNNTMFEKTTLSDKGKLLSFTEVTTPPVVFSDYAPYCIGMIELDHNVKITAQLTDVTIDELYVGMPVKAQLRKMYEASQDGIINYAVKFVPEI